VWRRIGLVLLLSTLTGVSMAACATAPLPRSDQERNSVVTSVPDAHVTVEATVGPTRPVVVPPPPTALPGPPTISPAATSVTAPAAVPTVAAGVPPPITPPAPPPLPPVECYDATLRFPVTGNAQLRTGWGTSAIDDPQTAISHALRALGMSPASGAPGVRFMLQTAPTHVSTWVAVSLWRAHQGVPSPTLPEWLGEDPLGYRLSPAQWAAMQA
jgi:hypothetical protein